jgi:hypothetical protein
MLKQDAVLSHDAKVPAVGGVGPTVAPECLAAGIGSEIYELGLSAEHVEIRARTILTAIKM